MTTVVETRLVCPAELDQDLGAPPAPAEGAVIRHNDAGGTWLETFTDWALYAAGLFNDAKADCDSSLEARPEGSAFSTRRASPTADQSSEF